MNESTIANLYQQLDAAYQDLEKATSVMELVGMSTKINRLDKQFHDELAELNKTLPTISTDELAASLSEFGEN